MLHFFSAEPIAFVLPALVYLTTVYLVMMWISTRASGM
jgi:hypothetical protein